MGAGVATAWLPNSPWRRPEWRWLRAVHLVESGRRLDSRIDDDWVAHARDALLGRGGRQSTAAAVRAAHEVWAGDPLVRGHSEARLIADESLPGIAARFGRPVEVVEAFEAVFFAVRGERERRATDWVARMAVGYSVFTGFTHPLPMAAWRLAAWTGGSVLLDMIHSVTTNGPLPARLVAGDDPAAREQLVRLRGEVWLALMAARTDEMFAHAVRLRRQLRAHEGRLLGRRPPVTAAEDAMERFLMAVPSRRRSADAGTDWDESLPVGRSMPGDGRPIANVGPDTAPSVCRSAADLRGKVMLGPAGNCPSVAGRDRRAG